jgi:hypothetical protein
MPQPPRDVLAVAADVEQRTDARLEVVAVVLGRLARVLEALDAFNGPRRRAWILTKLGFFDWSIW